MHRPGTRDADAPGHDSFLDIVANMVGILIILVMVVGVRVKNAPLATIPNETTQADRELEEIRASEASLRRDVLKVADQIRVVEEETLAQDWRRSALSTAVVTSQRKIQSLRDQLDAEERKDFDLRRSLAESRFRLEELERQRVQAETSRAEPILIESYPTPLSRTVDDQEAHFQLRGGQIAQIPLEKLIARLKEDARRQKYKLLDLPELTDTIGPIGGFRLRYTFVRYDIPPEVAMETGHSGSFARLKRWTLIPVSARLGEPVGMALAAGSEFRRTLAKLRPGRTTITIWTYPDGFAAFHRLQKELHHLGFAVAARPLPDDTPISGSPQGTNSAAE
jgi:hypothetical protein